MLSAKKEEMEQRDQQRREKLERMKQKRAEEALIKAKLAQQRLEVRSIIDS